MTPLHTTPDLDAEIGYTPLINVLEFEHLCETHPIYKAGNFELVHGEIVAKYNTMEHGLVAGATVYALGQYVHQTGRGRAGISVSIHSPKDYYNLRQPDISYFVDTTRPIVTKGAVPLMPDLAVEVHGRDQSRREMREKADYYLRNGSKLVWIIYPDTRTVEVCTWTGESLAITTLDEKATLTGGDVLPDFTVPLSDIFPAQTEMPKSE